MSLTFLKHGFVTTIPLLFTSLFSFAVIDRVIPIFGKTTPSLSDIIFSLFLSTMPAIASAIFAGIWIYPSLYFSKAIKRAAYNFTSGIIIGKTIAVFICFLLLNWLYNELTKNIKAYQLVDNTCQMMNTPPNTCYFIKLTLFQLGQSAADAALFTIVILILSLAILTIGYQLGLHHTKKIVEFRKKWGD